MLYPQWYFKGMYYLLFVLRRPLAHTLEIHEWALAWYDFSPKYFVHEGMGDVELGRLQQDIAEAMIAMRKKLADIVDSFIIDQNLDPNQLNEMKHSQWGMHFTSLTLLIAPQSFLMTLLTQYTYFFPMPFSGDPHVLYIF